MPTSSFFKHYYVPEEKADEFVEEMTREVPPTLTKDFETKFKHVWEIEDLLNKALADWFNVEQKVFFGVYTTSFFCA